MERIEIRMRVHGHGAVEIIGREACTKWRRHLDEWSLSRVGIEG